MIISASRRTDIPAFYSVWLMNRVGEGYCTVPNPFNRKQISTVSLSPEDVDVIVFWTRNPRPLMSSLRNLDQMGYRYYFHFTVSVLTESSGDMIPSYCLQLRTNPSISTILSGLLQQSKATRIAALSA